MHLSSMTNPVYGSRKCILEGLRRVFFFSPTVGTFILKVWKHPAVCDLFFFFFLLPGRDEGLAPKKKQTMIKNKIMKALYNCERSRRLGVYRQKDQHSKYSVGGSSASWKDLVVDLLRGMGVQLAGRPQCWTMGVRAGTSVKNDCKSVSSPINCFCGDFLNTLINMIWSNSCWRGFLFSHVLQ